jgi:hypothetical protein
VPGREAVHCRSALVGSKFGRAVPDPTAAHAGFGETRDALGRVVESGPLEGGLNVLQRIRQDQLLDQFLGRLLDESRGTSRRVADNRTAVGIGERRRLGTCQPQRGCVDHRHVP